MKKSVRIKILDEIAMDYIKGKIEPISIFSLNIIDQLIVLGFINIYVNCMNGIISRESCKEMKLKIMMQYELIKSRFIWLEKIYRNFVEIRRDTSGKTCDMAASLKSGDFFETLKLALEIIDKNHGRNIYIHMFNAAYNDKDFKKKALQEGNKQIDELLSKYGNEVPYSKMIERFYSAACEDDIMDVFKQLDPDRYIPLSNNIPEKSEEETNKKISNRLNVLYGGKKYED